MQGNKPTSRYSQGCIVWASYPLMDKVDKLKWRPVLIISSRSSNALDSDYIVVPVTKAIREEDFSLLISPDDVAGDLPIRSELRCNKPFTIRDVLIHELIGILATDKVEQAIQLTQAAIAFDKPALY